MKKGKRSTNVKDYSDNCKKNQGEYEENLIMLKIKLENIDIDFIPMSINEAIDQAIGGGYIQKRGKGYVIL